MSKKRGISYLQTKERKIIVNFTNHDKYVFKIWFQSKQLKLGNKKIAT